MRPPRRAFRSRCHGLDDGDGGVAEEAGGALWFQLYMWPDRSLSHKLVERARAAGFEGARS